MVRKLVPKTQTASLQTFSSKTGNCAKERDGHKLLLLRRIVLFHFCWFDHSGIKRNIWRLFIVKDIIQFAPKLKYSIKEKKFHFGFFSGKIGLKCLYKIKMFWRVTSLWRHTFFDPFLTFTCRKYLTSCRVTSFINNLQLFDFQIKLKFLKATKSANILSAASPTSPIILSCQS